MHDESNAPQNTSFPTALPTCDGERSGSLTANYGTISLTVFPAVSISRFRPPGNGRRR